MGERLLSARDVAGLLGLDRGTIYRYIREGRLPHVPLGKRIRFKQSDIDRFIQERSISVDFNFNGFLGTPIPEKNLDRWLRAVDRLYLKGGNGGLKKNQTRYLYAFGTVYLRRNVGGSESWGIDYTDEKGKRRQQIVKGALNRGQAVQVLIEKAKHVFNTHYGLPEPKRINFSDFCELYMQTHGRMKASGNTDEYRLRRLKVYFKNVDIAEVKPMMVQGYVAERLEENISKRTINRELALLKKFFNLAIGEGYLTENPVKKVKFFSKRDNVRDRILTEDEERRLLSAAPAHLRPVIIVALNTGLRKSEIENLCWQNVCLDKLKPELKIENTKSKKTRYIPVNSTLLSVLTALKAEGRDEGKVFPFRIRTAFENACRDAKIQGFVFHDLRRSFGTRLLENRYDIVTISKLYGHSSLLVTQIYLHPKDSTAQEAVESLVSKDGKSRAGEQSRLLHFCDLQKPGVPVSRLFSVN